MFLSHRISVEKRNDRHMYGNQATGKIVLPTKLILPPEGFYCEAAAGSAEAVLADKAQQ